MEIIKYNIHSIKNFIIQFLIFIFPLTLVSGPFIPDAIISISAILFLIFHKNEIFDYLKNSNFVKFFFIFFLYLIINSFFSEFILISLKTSITYMRFIVFICIIYYLCSHTSKNRHIFFLGLLLTFIVLCIDANFQFLTGKNFLGFEPQTAPLRISGLFKDELILGGFLARFFPLLIGLLYLYLNKNKNVFFYILILTLLVSFTIFIAAEKTAIALHLISVSLLIFFYDFPKRYKFFICISILFISILAILSNPHIKKRVITETLLNSDHGKYVFSKTHHAHYLTSINIFLDKPILGSGIKTFRYICNEDKYKVDRFDPPFQFWHLNCSTHTHNIYIQVLSETGIIGFIFLITFFIYVVLGLFRDFSGDKGEIYFQRTVIICLFINFFPFAPSGNFFNNYISMIYLLPVGFMLSNMKLNS